MQFNDIQNLERLADESEMASRAEAYIIRSALAAHSVRASVPLDPDFDGEHCVHCGIKIPKKRLLVVETDKCVDCSSYHAKKQRQFGHLS